MKIIVSHDVDHLFGRDHWFRDLIYPKMWAKALLHAVQGRITLRQAWLRATSCFRYERHRLDAVMSFDRAHGVPSTFFFGMNQGLGMSYRPEEAKSVIERVHDAGFAVGVHGIVYDDAAGIQKEYDTFRSLMGFAPCGLRMHYVRRDENTFARAAKAGYTFDTTEFDKPNCGTVKAPYRVGGMWEFPLTIMDGYLPQNPEAAKAATLRRLQECRDAGLEYATVLFHDYQFDDAYAGIRDWYIWLVETIERSETDSFVSYSEAIRALEDPTDE